MKKVLILFGGNSYEHNVSCNSVNFIINNIDTKIFNFKLVGIDFDNSWYEINKFITINKNWKDNDICKIGKTKHSRDYYDRMKQHSRTVYYGFVPYTDFLTGNPIATGFKIKNMILCIFG